MSKVWINLFRHGDIFVAGLWVQSNLLVIQFISPPMQPESSLLRSISGIVSAKYFTLLDLDDGSLPEGRYRLAKVISPMLNTIARHLESRRIFSGVKSDLMMEAVPYFVG